MTELLTPRPAIFEAWKLYDPQMTKVPPFIRSAQFDNAKTPRGVEGWISRMKPGVSSTTRAWERRRECMMYPKLTGEFNSAVRAHWTERGLHGGLVVGVYYFVAHRAFLFLLPPLVHAVLGIVVAAVENIAEQHPGEGVGTQQQT